MPNRDPPYSEILLAAIGLSVFVVGSYFFADSFYLPSITQWSGANILGFWGFWMMLAGLGLSFVGAFAARRPEFGSEFATPAPVSATSRQ